MGTRAVVQYDEGELDIGVHEIWYATHWDGHPETLGQHLVEAVQKAKGKVPSYSDDITRGDNLKKLVNKAVQDHSVDMKEYGSTGGDVEETFKDRYADYGEFEYKFVREGDDIRVKHRSVGGFWDDNPSKGEWKDTANVVGMTTEPHSFYHMYHMKEEGVYKVEKDGNKQATATGEDPDSIWQEGVKHVDNNTPASIVYWDQDDQIRKEYENTQIGKRN